jgi:ferritin-like metal-binding protein YciE
MLIDSLRRHLIEELADLLDAEHQLTKALPKMAASATTSTLKTAFRTHLKETRAHISRLKRPSGSWVKGLVAKRARVCRDCLARGRRS